MLVCVLLETRCLLIAQFLLSSLGNTHGLGLPVFLIGFSKSLVIEVFFALDSRSRGLFGVL